MKTSDYVTKHYRSAVGYAARLTRHIATAEIWESQWVVSSDRLYVVNPSSTAGLRGLVKTVRRHKRIKLYHYGHSRALFDTRACREGFKADRQAGLIYGPYFIKSLGRFAMCIEEASAIDRFCPYCNAKEGQPA